MNQLEEELIQLFLNLLNDESTLRHTVSLAPASVQDLETATVLLSCTVCKRWIPGRLFADVSDLVINIKKGSDWLEWQRDRIQ